MRAGLFLIAAALACMGPSSASAEFTPLVPNQQQTNQGAQLDTNDACPDATFDLVLKLCNIIGANCPSSGRACGRSARTLTGGTTLGKPVANPPKKPPPYNYRGGAGPFPSDAALCALRNLSKTKNGPLRNGVTIGGVTVEQEVGFKRFDPNTATFDGYRRIKIEMPVLGVTEAVRQDFQVKRATTVVPPLAAGLTGLAAGDRVISSGHGLTVSADRMSRNIAMTLSKILVTTPIGQVSVTPTGIYQTNSPFITLGPKASAFSIAKYLGDTEESTSFSDVYGSGGAFDWNIKPTGTAQNFGWTSVVGLGTRGGSLDAKVWSGAGARPDIDLSSARTAEESKGSIFAKAGAQVRYPDPEQLEQYLPAWVWDLPGLIPPEVYVEVTPNIYAQAAGQLALAQSDATVALPHGEFKTHYDQAAISAGAARMTGSAGLAVDYRLVIKVAVKVFGKRYDLVQIDDPYTLPIYPTPGTPPKASAQPWFMATASKSSLGGGDKKTITLWNGTTLTGTEMNAFIAECFATKQPQPEAPAPIVPEARGDANDLFKATNLWPCNVCLATPAYNDDKGKAVASKSGYWLTSTSGKPSFSCDLPNKSGCHDLCTFDPKTKKLTPVKTASQLGKDAVGQTKAKFAQCNAGPEPVIK